jgi:general secretion pathway protein A
MNLLVIVSKKDFSVFCFTFSDKTSKHEFEKGILRPYRGSKLLTSTGLMLIDVSFQPISADAESIKILGFPNAFVSPDSLDGILSQRIRSFLPTDIVQSPGEILTQFQSGQRRYLCRAYVLDSHWDTHPHEKRIVLLLERGLSGPPISAGKQRRLAGLHADPFSFAPDPKYYSFSRANMEVLSSLRSMVQEGRGIGVVLGPPGTGKTILINFLAGNLRGESEVAFLPGSFENRAELVRAVMAAFGIDSVGKDLADNLHRFEDWLLKKNLTGRRLTLICDDAQDFTIEALENLCRFSELEMGRQKLLQIVLAGRQALLDKLNVRRLDSISSKISVFCKLTPLDEAEVRTYILHRLRIAGCTRQLFSPQALSHIALYSRGVPLNVNMICRHCLSLAATVSLPIIDERMVADCAYDLVLRAQTCALWDEPENSDPEKPRRNRHGLKLIKS